MSRDHEERVHEDHHQHLLVQPCRGGPGYLAVRHASGTLPHVEAVSLDSRRGTVMFYYTFMHLISSNHLVLSKIKS